MRQKGKKPERLKNPVVIIQIQVSLFFVQQEHNGVQVHGKIGNTRFEDMNL